MAKRDVVKNVRFSRDELEQIKEFSQRCGLSASGYIRKCALGHKPRGKDMTMLVNQIAKQGGLLKHLHNEGLGHSDITAQLLKEMQSAIALIERVLSSNSKERVNGKHT